FRWNPKARDQKPGDVAIDLGTFNPLVGRSYMEIAGISRSMHKSQGFGAQELRGSWENDFRLRKGEAPSGEMFDGVDLSWRRVKGGEKVAPILEEAVRAYDPEKPSAVVPALLRAYAEMEKLGDDPDVLEKKADLLDVVRAAAGLHVEAIAKDYSVTPGKGLDVTLAAVNRSPLALTLDSVEVTQQEGALGKGDETFPTPLLEPGGTLPFNVRKSGKVTLRVPNDAEISNPYWLKEHHDLGLFHVTDRSRIGLPESPEPLFATFRISIAGTPLRFTTPVQYRWTDPVRGDLYRPIEIAPPVTVNFDEKVHLFGSKEPRRVRVTIAAEEPKAKGRLRFRVPSGWKAMPADVPFAFTVKGEEATIDVTLAPPAKPESATLGVDVVMDGGEGHTARGLVRIDYPHIPIQTLFPPAETRLVRLDVKTAPVEIGYVMGSGDEVPATLKQLGYKVTLLTDDDLASTELSRFPVIVLGVRAYNTRERLKALQPRLMAYVENGGTLVDQYVTTSELLVEHFGPYPLTIGRDRVTVEEAPMTFLKPAHPLLHVPNEI
ncbi:MAG TPA: LmbE family protein, partial [Thermoanaerobaculia bacterium]|nr:LmbE family protein [Thermoanaerobaculia bacterium]